MVDAISGIHRSSHAALVGVVIVDEPPRHERTDVCSRQGGGLWRYMARWDRLLAARLSGRVVGSDLTQPCAINEWQRQLDGTPVERASGGRVMQSVRRLQPEIVLDLSREMSTTQALAGTSRWTISLGAGTPTILPGLQEWGAKLDISRVGLWEDTGQDERSLLRSATVRIDQLSPHVAANSLCAHAVELVFDQLRTGSGVAQPCRGVFPGDSRHEPPHPSVGPVLAFIRWATQIVHILFQRLWRRDSWRILLTRSTDALGASGLANGQHLGGPGHLLADPHLVTKDDSVYLFAEEASRLPGERRLKGRIAVATLTNAPDSRLEFETALELPIHCSFPFVFQAGSDWLMAPETSQDRAVRLYRATTWPTEWVLDCTLLDGAPYVDPVLLHHANRWWLFVARPTYAGGSADVLELFVSTEVRGPWTPHPQSPIVRDIRCARPAGSILVVDGVLIRPGQDGSARYGSAVRHMRIERLTPTEYAETEHSTVAPDWDETLTGLHSWSVSSGWKAVDIGLKESRWR